MNYVIARASGPNNRDTTFQHLGCASGTTVNPPRTTYTGLYDAGGNPIHRVREPRETCGFFVPQG